MQWQSRLLLSSALNWILFILLIKISDSKQITSLVGKGNDMSLSVCQYNTQIYLIYVSHSNLLALRSTIMTAGTCSRDWAVHVIHLSPRLKNDVMKNKQRFHVHCYHLIIITVSISLFLLLTHRMSHRGERAVKTGEQQWMASGQPPNAFYAMMSNRWAYTKTKQLSRITLTRGHHPKFIFIRSLYQMMLTEISSKITQHARVWPHVVCLWCNESFWHYVWEILNKQIYYMPNNQGVSPLTPS